MQITREQISAITVRQVEPGQIRIGSEVLRHNVLVTADQEIRTWGIEDLDHLAESDFAGVLEAEPEMIVFGTGWSPLFPPREIVFALARRGIGFEAMDTPAACRTFNILINEGRRAAAALIVQAGAAAQSASAS
ncbi:MAG: MTH938/NDUFAF3 family protein [Woeseia sp.]